MFTGKVHGGGDSGFLRVGSNHDGGYVMWNDLSDVRIAYSAGIDGNVTWDLDMAKRGIQIYMYDHTIDAPTENHPNFHFFKTGLTGVYQSDHPELETLPRLIQINGHENDDRMILKMDIEGSEYNVLTEIDEDTLQHFLQIVIEFHHLHYMPGENTFLFALDKLNATHQAVHVHANNYGGAIIRAGKILPQTLEITYLRRDSYDFVKSTRFFPTKLDAPNNPEKEDYKLGYWG